jgi:hypothetical protein
MCLLCNSVRAKLENKSGAWFSAGAVAMIVWTIAFFLISCWSMDHPSEILYYFSGATMAAYTMATKTEPSLLQDFLGAVIWVAVLLIPVIPFARSKRVCCAQATFSLVQAFFGALTLVGSRF